MLIDWLIGLFGAQLRACGALADQAGARHQGLHVDGCISVDINTLLCPCTRSPGNRVGSAERVGKCRQKAVRHWGCWCSGDEPRIDEQHSGATGCQPDRQLEWDCSGMDNLVQRPPDRYSSDINPISISNWWRSACPSHRVAWDWRNCVTVRSWMVPLECYVLYDQVLIQLMYHASYHCTCLKTDIIVHRNMAYPVFRRVLTISVWKWSKKSLGPFAVW